MAQIRTDKISNLIIFILIRLYPCDPWQKLLYSLDAAVASVSRRVLADVVAGSSSSSSTLPRTFLPKTPFQGGMTIVALPKAFAWHESRKNGFSSSGWL